MQLSISSSAKIIAIPSDSEAIPRRNKSIVRAGTGQNFPISPDWRNNDG